MDKSKPKINEVTKLSKGALAASARAEKAQKQQELTRADAATLWHQAAMRAVEVAQIARIDAALASREAARWSDGSTSGRWLAVADAWDSALLATFEDGPEEIEDE